jgi:hypothetical protein
VNQKPTKISAAITMTKIAHTIHAVIAMKIPVPSPLKYIRYNRPHTYASPSLPIYVGVARRNA